MESLKESDNVEGLGINRKEISKWILWKEYMRRKLDLSGLGQGTLVALVNMAMNLKAQKKRVGHFLTR
jgi:hypothetical protein